MALDKQGTIEHTVESLDQQLKICVSAFSLKLRGEGEVDRWCVGLVLGKRAEEHWVPGVPISEGLDLLRDRRHGSP